MYVYNPKWYLQVYNLVSCAPRSLCLRTINPVTLYLGRFWELHDMIRWLRLSSPHDNIHVHNKCAASQGRLKLCEMCSYVAVWKLSKSVDNMKWSFVLFMILMTLSASAEIEVHVVNRYVIPSIAARCFNEQVPCQTIQQYATQPDVYFASNTSYYFQPGNHQLNSSLKLTNLQNVNFQGLPDDNVVNIFFGFMVSIIWENCSNIKLASINFIIPNNYSFSVIP